MDETTAAAPAPEVTISDDDINLMINTIDVVAQRGAFNQPIEFTAVGSLYQKLKYIQSKRKDTQ